jgi:Cysteine-rich CWC
MNDKLARCPRCGGDFQCGAADPATLCACKAVALDEPTLAALRERHAGCLCVGCLRDVQRGASLAEVLSA